MLILINVIIVNEYHNIFIILKEMSYYDYLELIYSSPYDRILEAELVAENIRRSRI